MKTIYVFSLIIGLVFTSCGQFNSTNTELHRESEKRLLKELRSDLVQNLNDINANIEFLELSENANRLIIDHMDKSIPYHDSLNYYFANLYPYLVFAPNETTFNYLKQTGMSIISNDSIRSAVSELYGVRFGIYKSYESIYFVEHYTNYIKPMFISEFKTFKFYRSFMPKNYSQFIKNRAYKRIMSYTADACQSFRFMQSDLKESVEKLISTIDTEINE
ncbi:MAG: hypothetical protein ABFS32_15245 [Bacteroidota bacterium]